MINTYNYTADMSQDQRFEFLKSNPDMATNNLGHLSDAQRRKEVGKQNKLVGAAFEQTIKDQFEKHVGVDLLFRTNPRAAGMPGKMRIVEEGFVDWVALLSGRDFGQFERTSAIMGHSIYFDAKTKMAPKQLKSGMKEEFSIKLDHHQYKKLKICANKFQVAAFLVYYLWAGPVWHFIEPDGPDDYIPNDGRKSYTVVPSDGISCNTSDLLTPAMSQKIKLFTMQIQNA